MKQLKKKKKEFLTALFEGSVNAIVAFIGAWAVTGLSQSSLRIALIFGLIRFVSCMKELDWVSLNLNELPKKTSDRSNRVKKFEKLCKNSISNIGRFI